jgi:hypothetical protein
MVVILALGLTFIQSVRSAIQQDVLKSVLGVQNEEPYLDHNLSWYAPAMRTVREGGIPTLLIYEPRGYYCSPKCMPDEVLERWSSDYHRLGSCEAVVNSWRSDGYEQILVYKGGVEFFLDGKDPNHTPSDLSALQECLATLPVKQDYGGIYKLYGIMD